MILSKLPVITDISSVDNAKIEFMKYVFIDIANTLKIDNTPILRYESFSEDPTYRSKTIALFGRSWDRYAFINSINNFSDIDIGLTFVFDKGGSGPTTLPMRIEYDDTTEPVTDVTTLANYTIMPFMAQQSAIIDVINTPYFLYNGTSIAYFAIANINHGMLFAKMKSVDDPTSFKYVVIISGTNYDTYRYNDKYGFVNGIQIFDNPNLQSTRYTDKIRYSANGDLDTICIEKFIHNGYYSDDIFLFDGACPKGLFTLDNVTYLNIGFNMYIKITG